MSPALIPETEFIFFDAGLDLNFFVKLHFNIYYSTLTMTFFETRVGLEHDISRTDNNFEDFLYSISIYIIIILIIAYM